MARSSSDVSQRVFATSIGRRRRRSIALALLAVATACHSRRPLPSREDETVTIRISNNHPLDVTIYAVNQGMRVRLGTVSTGRSERFPLALRDINPSGELRLLADPVGSRRTTLSEPILVFPGQTVEWVLGADLQQSTLTVRS